MTKTDYETTRDKCWEGYLAVDSPKPAAWNYGHAKEAFDFAFLSAYRYGRLVGMEEAKAQLVEPHDKFVNSEQLRVQAAIAAMQGLMAHKETFRDTPFNDIPKMAVIMVDALLAELDKTKDDGKDRSI